MTLNAMEREAWQARLYSTLVSAKGDTCYAQPVVLGERDATGIDDCFGCVSVLHAKGVECWNQG
ncbi:MAG TPA: hypothetical protein ACQGQH_04635 [Xylella sp.]